MTFAHYWFGTMASVFGILATSYLAMKLLWPMLKRNRWVLHDWEGWR